MKRIFILIITCLMAVSASAQKVDVTTALKVAENFYAGQNRQKAAPQLELYVVQQAEGMQKSAEQPVSYYIFNDGVQGFVMVAGDYRISPILGYSTTNSFDTTGMPDNLRWWLQMYREEIAQYISETETSAADELWEAYRDGNTFVTMGTTAVAPLVKTKWNQGWPYNNLCPYDSKAKHRCPSGCVATAMAQVLKFWNYPQKGVGSHSFKHDKYGNLSANFGSTTYDWTHMNNTYPSGSDTVSRMAVATLMYHCGVSVDMEYDTNGSGAVVYMPDRYVQYYGFYDARTALKNYFDCDTVLGYYRSDYNNLTSWTNLLKGELDAGRPILYAGTGNAGGHAFVCDGYDANGKFHINWGWGGTSDGYFGISALNPSALGTGGGAGGFNTNQQALFVRPGTKETEHYDLRLYKQLTISRDTVPLNSPFSITALIANFGDSSYAGAYAMGVYKSDGSFVGYMDTKNNRTLENGYYDSIVFSTTGMSALSDGIYYAKAFYKKGEGWKEINGGNYTNKLTFFVGTGASMEYDLRLYSALNASSEPVPVGNAFYIYSSIGNYDVKDFNGTIAVNIYNEDGTQMGIYGQTKIGETLQAGKYVPNFKCNFNADHGLPAGTYIASLVYTTDEDDTWHLIGDGNYTNRLVFRISDGSGYIMKLYSPLRISADPVPYNSAFNITVSILNQGEDAYSNGKLAMGIFDTQDNLVGFVQTYENISLGIHKYFNNVKFSTTGMPELAAGGSYVAKACMYNNKTNTWDVVLSGNYINALPFSIKQGVGIAEATTGNDKIYPNPTTGIVTLKLNGVTTTIKVTDAVGRLLFTETAGEGEHTIDLSGFSEGIYFVRTICGTSVTTHKVIKL